MIQSFCEGVLAVLGKSTEPDHTHSVRRRRRKVIGNRGTTGGRGGGVVLPSGDQQGQKERALRHGIRAKVSTSTR